MTIQVSQSIYDQILSLKEERQNFLLETNGAIETHEAELTNLQNLKALVEQMIINYDAILADLEVI